MFVTYKKNSTKLFWTQKCYIIKLQLFSGDVYVFSYIYTSYAKCWLHIDFVLCRFMALICGTANCYSIWDKQLRMISECQLHGMKNKGFYISIVLIEDEVITRKYIKSFEFDMHSYSYFLMWGLEKLSDYEYTYL